MPENPASAAGTPATPVLRNCALANVAVAGRFGASRGPGVVLSVRHPASIVTVIARKDCAGQTLSALKALAGCDVQWAGADQYFVVADNRGEGALYRELKALLEGVATVSDQSHGRVIMRIGGPKARNVLAKGTPVDLHPKEFPVGKSAVTQMAHVGVHFTRTGEDDYELSVFRGFAESFWEWLTTQAEEFGYQVI